MCPAPHKSNQRIKMKTWLYFYVEYTVKYGKPFYKEIGWSLGLKNNYIALSKVIS